MGTCKGLILSGGSGVRMRPFSHAGPKQLLPVANRPVLDYAVAEMIAAGVAELVVVTGSSEAGRVRSALDQLAHGALAVQVVEQDAPRGLAHAVALAQPWLADGPFLMQLGDNLVPGGALHLARAFAANPCAAAILLAPVSEPSRYGIAVLDQHDLVQRLVEKPAEPPGNLALVGVYAFSPAIFAAIEDTAPSARGELEITDAIQRLVEQGQDVIGVEQRDWWLDVGTPADLLQANRRLLDRLAPQVDGELIATRTDGLVRVGAGSRLLGCTLRGPVLVGCGCDLEDADLGPYVAIGDGARLRGCALAESVVLSGAVVDGPVRQLRHSIIGSSAQVLGGAQTRLLLGDACRVEGI